jgi:hypothetical protein
MEMMDIPAAIDWLNGSAELMKVSAKALEPQPEGECDPLDREVIAAKRKLVASLLHNTAAASFAIMDQIFVELPLLMGHTQDLAALQTALNLHGAEMDNVRRNLDKTAPPETPEPAPNDVAEISEAEKIEMLFPKLYRAARGGPKSAP